MRSSSGCFFVTLAHVSQQHNILIIINTVSPSITHSYTSYLTNKHTMATASAMLQQHQHRLLKHRCFASLISVLKALGSIARVSHCICMKSNIYLVHLKQMFFHGDSGSAVILSSSTWTGLFCRERQHCLSHKVSFIYSINHLLMCLFK